MSRFKRLSVTFALLVASIGVGATVAASPAMADPACTNGYVCLFSDINGGGSVLSIPASYGSCYSLGGGWNNIASSVVSRAGFAIHLTDNWDCSGQYVYLGNANPNYSGSFGWPNVPSMNDRVGAIQFWH